MHNVFPRGRQGAKTADWWMVNDVNEVDFHTATAHMHSRPQRPHQSRPQSPRYPCPAERENEDLWEDPFELGISLAINRACAVPPEVDKQ